MKNRIKNLHYLGLIGTLVLGAILRFCNLDAKPLWLDEVITAIFSLGKNYHDIPLDVALPLDSLQEIFTFQPGVSCSQIAENITHQSTHPPLFFCGMRFWLEWLGYNSKQWLWYLRSLPALLGTIAIAAIYFVNRIAFSPKAGLMGAVIMAISPFAVYLSQEARHYTLPMLLITLSLLGLVQIQRDIFSEYRVRIWVWLGWTIVNCIGLYVHYFFLLALTAEVATLGLLLFYRIRQAGQISYNILLALGLSIAATAIGFLPWLPKMVSHFTRSETDWLHSPENISPLYQTLGSWVMMVVSLPVEHQPLSVVVVSGAYMLYFGIWLGWKIFKGLQQLWFNPTTHVAVLTLLSFTSWVLLEFLAIIYIFNKDITAVPRYNFVYYPGFCALLGASLAQSYKFKFQGRNSILIILLVGILSSIFVVTNLVFQKPFEPDRVAQNMNVEPNVTLILGVGCESNQDVALGLSFALALSEARSNIQSQDRVAFFKVSSSIQSVWEKITLMRSPAPNFNLWLVVTGLKRKDFPKEFNFRDNSRCQIDRQNYHRIGVPYQMYRCVSFPGL